MVDIRRSVEHVCVYCTKSEKQGILRIMTRMLVGALVGSFFRVFSSEEVYIRFLAIILCDVHNVSCALHSPWASSYFRETPPMLISCSYRLSTKLESRLTG